MQRKKLSKEMAMQKIRHYCAYQERCHSEVKEKLYGFGLYKNEVEELIAGLIEDNYLNEERFAIHYAGGKFRMKVWGRKKIEYELKQKQISPYCIKKALREIDEDEYYAALKKLAEKTKERTEGANEFAEKQKLKNYLFSRGFEMNLIESALKEI